MNSILFNQLLIISFLLLISFIIYKFNRKQIAFCLVKLICIYFVVIAILPTGNFMLSSLENQFNVPETLPKNVDGILVLSGGENIDKTKKFNQIYTEGSTFRIIESLRLQNLYPDIKIIFTGGSGSHFSRETSTYAAEMFYQEFSINPENIIFESKSTNTYENFLFTNQIIDFEKNNNWIIITSAFHMPRAIKVADAFGLNSTPYPVGFKASDNNLETFFNFNLLTNITYTQIAIKEYLGLITYYLLYRV